MLGLKFSKIYINQISLILTIFSFNYPVFSEIENNLENNRNELNKNNTNTLTTNYFNRYPSNDYIIGSGDTISINVSDIYPELSKVVKIDYQGKIDLPQLKKLYVAGLTLEELNNLLEQKYLSFINYPDVSSEIIDYRPIRVLVQGEVNKPGILSLKGALASVESPNFNLVNPLSSGISNTPNSKLNFFPTLFDVIQKSGGITQNSNLNEVQIIRKDTISNGGGYKSTTINFENIFNGDFSTNVRIYDGDQIIVKKSLNPDFKAFSKAISSNLNSQTINVRVSGKLAKNGTGGSFELPRVSTLNDALFVSGGVHPLKGPIKLIRFNRDGTIERRNLRFNPNAKRGSYKNPYLQDFDVVFVSDSIFSTTSTVLGEIISPFSQALSAYAIIEALGNK